MNLVQPDFNGVIAIQAVKNILITGERSDECRRYTSQIQLKVLGKRGECTNHNNMKNKIIDC